MKKILSTLFILMLVSSVGNAEGVKSSDVSGQKVKKNLIEKTEGTITAIAKANTGKGDFGGFTVISDGKTKDFRLIAKTNFYTSEPARITFGDLKKGDQVEVLWVATLKGYNNVITVTQMK